MLFKILKEIKNLFSQNNSSEANSWEYWKREGPSGVYEIYRSPKNISGNQRLAHMERLQKDLSWRHDSKDNALNTEWAQGWFSFDTDMLTLVEVENFIAQWKNSNWPGRS